MTTSDDRRPIIDYYVGLDLGQANDYTAISIIELEVGYHGWDGFNHWSDFIREPEEFNYNITWLQRFKRGTSYPNQIRQTKQLIDRIPTAGKGRGDYGKAEIYLAVDYTGVGRAPFDLLVEAGLKPVAITITGGQEVNKAENGYNVPKRDLITNIQVLQQQRRLQLVPGLPDGEILAKEMANFKYKINLNGHDTYDAWREKDHDDLVLSVACAAWLAQEQGNHRWSTVDPAIAWELANMDGNGWYQDNPYR